MSQTPATPDQTGPSEHPSIVTEAEWLRARRDLLVGEKQLTRQRDALAAARRTMPMVEVTKNYVFHGPAGPISLPELFDGRRQLIVYHFMFQPEWDEGCPSCSLLADSFGDNPVHLTARDTSFVVVSRAPMAKIEPFQRRMGWKFTWVSSAGTDFNDDAHVTIDEDAGLDEYNYDSVTKLKELGRIFIDKGELPGLSVFWRDGDRVFHTYSAYERGLDHLMNIYNYLDLTPLGRGIDDKDPYLMQWVRHHDRYPAPTNSIDRVQRIGADRERRRLRGSWPRRLGAGGAA